MPIRFRVAGCVAGLILAGAIDLPASAQPSSGCILDHCEDRLPPGAPGRPAPPPAQPPSPPIQPSDDGGAVPAPPPATQGGLFRGPSAATGNFDFYVLSLSWSASFCADGGADKSPDQCDIGSHLTFVVHGLWPQFEHGFPADCDPNARPPTRAALDATHGVYPDEGLARYEFRKHGTCTGKAAGDYFNDVRFARDAVKIPPDFGQISQDVLVAPPDVIRAFQIANPRLRAGMMAVGCQDGLLQEVRVCFTKDLRDFRACPEVARGTCRSPEIRIPAPH